MNFRLDDETGEASAHHLLDHTGLAATEQINDVLRSRDMALRAIYNIKSDDQERLCRRDLPIVSDRLYEQ